MVIGRVFMSLTLILAIPVQMHPCRNSIRSLYFQARGKALPSEYNIVNTVTTLCILVFITLFAIFLPNILFVFNFLGGFCAAIICLAVPAIIYFGLPMRFGLRLAVLIGAIFFTLCGFVSVGMAIANL
jgi:amino acid permease